MTRYVASRLGQAVAVLFVVTLIVYTLIHSLPNGAGRALLGQLATPEQIARFNHEQGYDKPLPVQYGIWIGHLFGGDLGYSSYLNQSVGSAVWQAVPKTLFLTAAATLVSLAIAMPLAILQAVRRNKLSDYVVSGFSFVLYAMPSFFLGLVLVILFAVRLRMFPTEAPQTSSLAEILHDLRAMVLPIATLSLGSVAWFCRYLRSSLLDGMSEDWVRTARAKGANGRRVMWRHVLRASLCPVVTLLGMNVTWMLSGSIVVEQIFNYPGVGLLFWNSAQANDFPVVLAIVLLVGFATVMGNLLADIGYAILDPRVRYRSAVTRTGGAP
jgi:peptide/nickel transport system permease protein